MKVIHNPQCLGTSRKIGVRSRFLVALTVVALLMVSLPFVTEAAGVTWYVTRPGDSVTDGDLPTARGTLRFVLAHATAGDFVSFVELDAVGDRIFAGSTLVIPDGVAVGNPPGLSCGDFTTPFAIVEALTRTVNPVMSLGAGASLRGINIGGGDVSVRVDGADAEICGVGLGVEYDDDGVMTTLPPWHAALAVDAPGAQVHSNFINGDMVVSTQASGSRIGDTLTGSGEGNLGGCGNQGRCALTIMADSLNAAKQVTVRDPFPRSLQGMVGDGVAGGDDVANHANNWAQTPVILSATSHDAFLTFHVVGSASPFSLVDLFMDNGTTTERRATLNAGADGAFVYAGALAGQAVDLFTISTLQDATHADRVGSSSELSSVKRVIAEAQPPQPALSANLTLANLTSPGINGVSVGERLRLTVTLVSMGAISVTQIAGNKLILPVGFEPMLGSGLVVGGDGFVAGDQGFSEGSLEPAASATFVLDLMVTPLASQGQGVITMEVSGDRVVALPLVARLDVRPRWILPWIGAAR